MPRFFFDFFDGQSWSADDVGLELASAEQAYLEAFEGARCMWAELIEARHDPTPCAFEVKGDGGQSLFRLGFAELADSCRESSCNLPIAAMARTLQDTHRRVSTARVELQTTFAEVRNTLEESYKLLARLSPSQ